MVAALIDQPTFRPHVLDINGDSCRLKAAIQSRLKQGGSNICERPAHFFIDIYNLKKANKQESCRSMDQLMPRQLFGKMIYRPLYSITNFIPSITYKKNVRTGRKAS